MVEEADQDLWLALPTTQIPVQLAGARQPF